MATRFITLAGALTFATQVVAHGIVTGIVADGQYNLGYDPGFQYRNPTPTVAGWSIPQVTDRGFVTDLNGPDIICHRGATPGGTYVKIAAGGTLEFQWTQWPEGHHGPMIDYLAPCNGDCTTVDKQALRFIKVAEAGLNNGSPSPGSWASDDMIRNNNTWSVQVPSDTAPGKYVWRHEAIALHSAHESHGAQPYPQCVNVEIIGSGSNDMSGGTPATDFYSWQDPGLALNIYYPPLQNYTIPGPPLMKGGSDGQTVKPSSIASSSTLSPTSSSGNFSVVPFPTNGPTGGAIGRPTPSHPTGRPGDDETSPSAGSTTAPSTSQFVKPTTVPQQNQAQPQQPKSPEQPARDDLPGSPSLPPSQPQPELPAEEGDYPAKPALSSTVPVSFTSTWTGRIGKPTKFTCYAEE